MEQRLVERVDPGISAISYRDVARILPESVSNLTETPAPQVAEASGVSTAALAKPPRTEKNSKHQKWARDTLAAVGLTDCILAPGHIHGRAKLVVMSRSIASSVPGIRSRQ